MLNKAQKQAVDSESSRILCLAGAGTGKTRVLTQRVSRIVEEELAEPWQILCLTFTRAAGAEMKERIAAIIGDKAENIFCNTYHAWAARILRQYPFRIGLTPEFSIYDQEDRDSIITRIIDDLSFKVKLKDVTDAMNKQTLYRVPLPKGDISYIVDEYKSRLRRQNAIDLDGLIAGLQYILTDERIREEIRDRYKYVFVDEFQDTDHRQMEILDAINPDNLFVVGDDFQSIYGFRGADVNIIMGMAEDPTYEVIKLEVNYRSTVPIVNAANRLIKHNKQTEKILISNREGEPVEYVTADDAAGEMDIIISWLDFAKNIREKDYSKCAILTRTNAQLQAAAQALENVNIPYELKNKASEVLLTQEAKTMFNWMKVILNPQDDTAMKAIINWPKKTAGRQELLRAEMYSLENNCSLYTALCATETATETLDIIQKVNTLINELWDKNEDVSALFLYRQIVYALQINDFYDEQGRQNKIMAISMIEKEVEGWSNHVEEIGDPHSAKAWLEYYAMILINGIIDKPQEDKEDAVQLMTVHGSKGLEFENVYIIDCYNGSFPIKRGDIEEERRLFYVAMTRAKSTLTIIKPDNRLTWGSNATKTEDSPFISEYQKGEINK